MSYIQEFAEKSFLPPVFGARTGISDSSNQPYLDLEHPVALARFIAFVKAREQDHGSEVFLRGQTHDHVGMRPGLFRNEGLDPARLQHAYSAVLEVAPHHLEYLRFARENIGAVFQHYGMRTPWLDVVDNIYTALWFATHTTKNVGDGRVQHVASSERHGWVYLVATRLPDDRRLCVVDLRKQQSSMNLRLQVQHGLSLASQEDLEPIRDRDYGAFVVARIRFPNSSRFRYSGALANQSFFFPPPSMDESYRILRDLGFDDVLRQSENAHGLPSGALGSLHQVCYRLRRRPGQHPDGAV